MSFLNLYFNVRIVFYDRYKRLFGRRLKIDNKAIF